MPDTYISAAMRAAIGRRLSRQVSFPITDSDIRRWAIAVYYPEQPPPEFWDEEYAAKTRHGGIVAPEEFNPFAWMVADHDEPPAVIGDNDPDRTELLLGVPGPGLRFQLNGGVEVAYGVRMRPGDVITDEECLADYRERQGRLGLMLISVTEHTWTNQTGDFVKRTRQTLIRY